MSAPILSRRSFLVSTLSAAGGLAVGVGAGSAEAFPALPEPWSAEAPTDPQEINAWLLIEPDDTVIIRVAQSEMGEGIFTALPMIVAEGLECDFAKVRPEYASANRNLDGGPYGRAGTGGSGAVRRSREFPQQAGASARVRLIAAAAQRWNVQASACVAQSGTIIHVESGRTLTFGAVAAEAAKITLEREPAIKRPEQFRLIGQPTASRYGGQGRWDRPIRDRYAIARYGLCGGVWRHA